MIYYSGFDKSFKKALKEYKRTFDTDFGNLQKVIKGKLPLIGEDPRKLPQARQISDLGEKIKHPIIKMRMHIRECQEHKGRVVFLFDKDKKKIFFIDTYIKNKDENHDKAIINHAYDEYCAEHL